MTARTLLCALLVVATNAIALPVPFTSTLRSNNDVAVNGSTADFQTGQSPPSALPLITTALSFGNLDFASASSVNAPGLLNTSAEADSNTGFASSDATAEFFGSFAGPYYINLQLGLDVLFSSSTGNGSFAGTNLFVAVINGSNTLYSNVFSAPGLFNITFATPSSGVTTIDVLLESAASVITGGSAFNAATVSFAATVVPEPSTYALVALGIVLVLLMSRTRLRSFL